MIYLITDLALHDILHVHRHFRPSQNRKWLTAKWLTHGKQLQEVAVWVKLENHPPGDPFYRSKPSLITVICMDPHSPNKLFGTKYCFLILEDEFLFLSHFFLSFLFLLLFYVILLLLIFTKTMLLLSFFLINFFSWKLLLFYSCSGMFRHVPCSRFYRRPF